MSAPPPYPASSPGSLSVVDVENAVGSRLAMAELGLAAPLLIAGRYRVQRLLGRGARGVVCQAQDLHLHREVALKLYPALEPGPAAQEVALEAQALARLRHPNVVGVYDFGDTHLMLEHDPPMSVPCFFMTMEHIRGQSMRRWLSVGAPDRDQILAAFHQAGAGLAHAHEAGVVHRDFKPENVVIADDGRVLVVDFGLARHRSGTQASPAESRALALWQPFVIAGTPEYMAPEARLGRADASSDQYSFAVALHEALLGSLPAIGEQGVAWIAVERFPAAVARVLARALGFDARERYPNMRELLSQLPQRWGEQWRWLEVAGESTVERRPRWVLGGIGIGALVIGWLGLAAWWTGRSDEPAPEAASTSLEPRVAAKTRSACDADVVGRWELETRVVWDVDIDRMNQLHGYVLDITRDADCRLWGKMLRLKNGKADESELSIEWSEGDAVEIRGDWSVPERRIFTLVVEGDQVRGNFVMLQRHDRATIRAVVTGSRKDARPPKLDDLADLPCRSQCRMLCPGDSALAACMSSCQTVDSDVADCGPPGPDFETPQTTRTMQSDWSAGKWVGEGSPAACARGPDQVAGKWVIWAGPLRWSVSLERSGECRVAGQARSDAGDLIAVVGEFDDMGRWMLYDRNDPERLRWALYGWDFVFGDGAGRNPAKLSGIQSSSF
ncbi:protein kinase domain-containing protein [Nannocystaceae bacterium ST9]